MADHLPALPRRLIGLGMVALAVGFLGLCVAAYNKVFSPTVPVTMRIDAVDNTLLPAAEIRLRGVTVGEVRTITTDGDQATVELALQPEHTAFIPKNVTAWLVPRTLFGESVVALQVPPDPTAEPISAGDVIPRDRSARAQQVEQVLDNIFPLLTAVQPAELATTLGAVNQALTGRGEQLGDTLVALHDYLSRLNPALPELSADIRALPTFADTNAEALPALVEAAKNLTTTSRTLVQRRGDVEGLLRILTGTARDTETFLDDNGDNIVELADVARPTLELLAKYSPEFSCFFGQLAETRELADTAFGKGTERPAVRIRLEILPSTPKYLPRRDEPEFQDERGPRCYQPDVPQEQFPDNGREARDGSQPRPPDGLLSTGSLAPTVRGGAR